MGFNLCLALCFVFLTFLLFNVCLLFKMLVKKKIASVVFSALSLLIILYMVKTNLKTRSSIFIFLSDNFCFFVMLLLGGSKIGKMVHTVSPHFYKRERRIAWGSILVGGVGWLNFWSCYKINDAPFFVCLPFSLSLSLPQKKKRVNNKKSITFWKFWSTISIFVSSGLNLGAIGLWADKIFWRSSQLSAGL